MDSLPVSKASLTHISLLDPSLLWSQYVKREEVRRGESSRRRRVRRKRKRNWTVQRQQSTTEILKTQSFCEGTTSGSLGEKSGSTTLGHPNYTYSKLGSEPWTVWLCGWDWINPTHHLWQSVLLLTLFQPVERQLQSPTSSRAERRCPYQLMGQHSAASL